MRVAVVGLGLMGEPIARRLLGAGHELTVFNRTPERAAPFEADGATVAPGLGAVWETADVCVTMVANDSALESVAQELLGDGRKGRVLVDMSTISPTASARVAEAAATVGVGYLRAPVSGNPTVVRAGNLSIMVSGDRAAFDEVEPLLRDVGPTVFHVGDGEQARVLKLALNMMIAGTMQLMAEAVVLAEANGLDRGTLLEVMGASAVGAPFVKYKTAALVARDYTTTFSTENMHKDLTLAIAAASEAGVSLPALELLEQLVQSCIDAGLGESDLSALVPNLQRAVGVDADL